MATPTFTAAVGSNGLLLTATPVDTNGVSQPIFSVPVWTLDVPADFTAVTPSADGLTCQVTTPITAGTVNGTVTAEGDPVVGKNPLKGTFIIDVTPAVVVAAEDTTINVTAAPL